ncbi:pentatricopeptide repeat-containing protein At4g20770-like [Papaver somniferum]|uniref:pentatricopeptide repeat-containing protein At4g20770-like n=1 Tax=Papaver somniferum TaxID=3469 RepID=UPI000E704F11|nr:pentatricopeptide repeat-containing protein At4g20770-like [Papaver somniferum]XP_026423697.1 pentatricopeptide repeat-containing protein At4g20770-like [Papaver somniferum]XP_026423701.1 pentatricopeptide repeat-containing protein At4g20770-like [Papaver somniferum]XP_026423707.1 pentatricopeptide repeat-containing protein At4g20770-like [Papaver somniferum]XP_026423711.1 pentatricopeptide repeat-containing protein At4g20770-like [Papaver somniferum]
MESKVTYIANLLQSCIDKKSHITNKILHCQILRNGLFGDIFLSNRLIETYSVCKNLESAQKVFDKMPSRNVYTWNAMVGGLSKAGKAEDAYDVFVKMPERNDVSYITVIDALVRNGYGEKALELYGLMRRQGFVASHFTLTSVLSACGSLVEGEEEGRKCHGYVIKVGLNCNVYVENALVGMYAKCGSIVNAIRAFDDMSYPNEVSFTALMGGLAQTDRFDEALEMFVKMHKKGIRIDPIAFSSIIGICAKRESCFPNENSVFSSRNFYGQGVHSLIMKVGFETNLHVANSLIDMYAKHGDMVNAEMLFASLAVTNVVSWNVLIAGYGLQGKVDKALEMVLLMGCHGLEPDEVTYVNALSACVKSGDLETGRQMFGKLSNPSITSWNAIVSGYSQLGNYGEAINLFREMQFLNTRPDRTTIASILSSCTGMGLLEYGKQVHAFSIKQNLHGDIFVSSGLVDMYSKCGNIKTAIYIFNRMPERDIVCWNSMITGLSLHSFNPEAFTIFKQMRKSGMIPTEFSYASVLNSCSGLASLSQGKQVHAQITKDGYTNNIFVGSALIDVYSKCGDVDGARIFFDNMLSRSIVAWNEMIHGYAQNGYGDEAVKLFEDLIRSSEKPDSITYIAVLTACSHSGLADMGMEILDSMQRNVEPLVGHYTCVIDCLGRAGRFVEAEVLIDKMPYKNHPIIWEVLLSSCRVHANVNLARRAAEQLFKLDPQNSAPYVLLSNLYASLGRWDDASAVRQLMCERGIEKNPGYSWIGCRNGENAFMSEDDLNLVTDIVR